MGGDSGGVVADGGGDAIGGVADAVADVRVSGPLLPRPRPKASLNIAPYQSARASAACIHGCVARLETSIAAVTG
jgi:hypothetical protein